MTLTSHHHHWNVLEAKGNAQSCQSHCDIDPNPGGGGPEPDSAVVNSLAKLFWHLDQARRRFWIPSFWEPSPQVESYFPSLESRKATQDASHQEKWLVLLPGYGRQAEEALWITKWSTGCGIQRLLSCLSHLLTVWTWHGPRAILAPAPLSLKWGHSYCLSLIRPL